MNRIYSPINQIYGREKTWLNQTAKWLRIKGITPHQLSIISLLLSFLSGINFYIAFQGVSFWLKGILLLTVALFIQARLICTVLDSLLTGDAFLASSYNPISSLLYERLADSVLFIGIGLGLMPMPMAIILGWLAALLSVLVAYSRFLSATFKLHYSALNKPSKQYSLACVCGCSIIAAFLPQYASQFLLYACLLFIIIGFVFLCFLYT